MDIKTSRISAVESTRAAGGKYSHQGNDPIGENLLPDRGYLHYLGPKNLTKLKCAKNGAKSGCFNTSIVFLTQKKHKLPKRKKNLPLCFFKNVRSFKYKCVAT